MSVVNFPVCRFLSHALVGPNRVAEGLHWYGGRGFKTKQDVIDCMSDKDWRRIVQWERRNADYVASGQSLKHRQHRGQCRLDAQAC